MLYSLLEFILVSLMRGGKMRSKIILVIFLSLILFSGILYAPQESRLMRFPAIHKDQIVFTYAGDLYLVLATGGVARRKLPLPENTTEIGKSI